jgi:hypothetical protein
MKDANGGNTDNAYNVRQLNNTIIPWCFLAFIYISLPSLSVLEA